MPISEKVENPFRSDVAGLPAGERARAAAPPGRGGGCGGCGGCAAGGRRGARCALASAMRMVRLRTSSLLRSAEAVPDAALGYP